MAVSIAGASSNRFFSNSAILRHVARRKKVGQNRTIEARLFA
jgi:hypothetical protein